MRALIPLSGVAVAFIAAAAPAHAATPNSWMQVDKASAPAPTGELRESEMDELKRLRRENERLRMEREILKKPPSSLRKKSSKVRLYSRATEDLSCDSFMPRHGRE